MSTTGGSVDALMRELIRASKGRSRGQKPKPGRPGPKPKAITKAQIRNLERELKG